MKRPIWLVCLLLASCGLVVSPQSVCEHAATDYSGQVVGAFKTSVGEVRAIQPREPGWLDPEPLWPDRAADYPAVLCYIDGEVAKAPPPGPNGEVRDPFDRAIVAVVDGVARLVAAGYRNSLPIRAP